MATIDPVPTTPRDAAAHLDDIIRGGHPDSLGAALADAANSAAMSRDRSGFTHLADLLRHLADTADVIGGRTPPTNGA